MADKYIDEIVVKTESYDIKDNTAHEAIDKINERLDKKANIANAVSNVAFSPENGFVQTIGEETNTIVSASNLKTGLGLNHVTNISSETIYGTVDAKISNAIGSLGAAASKNVDNTVTKDSGNLITSGAVQKGIHDELAKIVANAPADFDTLKEISDWISNHENSAAAMNSAIAGKVTRSGSNSGSISFDSNGNIEFGITDAWFDANIK